MQLIIIVGFLFKLFVGWIVLIQSNKFFSALIDLFFIDIDLIPFFINPYAIALATPPAPMIRQSLLVKDKS